MSPSLIICHFLSLILSTKYLIIWESFIHHSNVSICIYMQQLSFYTREIGHETKLSFFIVHAQSDIWQYSLWDAE